MSDDIVRLITSKEFITTNIVIGLIVSVAGNFLSMWLVKLRKKSVLEVLQIVETMAVALGVIGMVVAIAVEVGLNYRPEIGTDQIKLISAICWKAFGFCGGTSLILFSVLSPLRVRKKPKAPGPIPKYLDWGLLALCSVLGVMMVLATLFSIGP